MIALRRAEERGRTKLAWLDSHHSFSFAGYHDPAHMGFGVLRVINDDRVAPGAGFPTHGHRDMEIVTYLLDGALAHEDTTGARSVIRAGEVQRMSAGTGIRHSEFNASEEEPLRFLQIWIEPDALGFEPGYEQRPFGAEEMRGRFRLIASRDGREGSLRLHQDAAIHAARLKPGDHLGHSLAPGRRAWLQLARGRILLDGADFDGVDFERVELGEGDGAALGALERIEIEASEGAELLLFDLA
jgi:redox-sensitive bicupin YhaK (pirin superfamily)